jgi:hypothetical protein
MCAPLVVMGVAMAASAAMSAKGASDQADAQAEAGAYTAKSAGRNRARSDFEAQQILDKSQEQARQVRAQAIAVRGKQIATQAASGIVVGDGSAQAMVDEVTQLAEQDAVAYLMSGANGYISQSEKGRLEQMDGEFQAKQLMKQSNNTRFNGIVGAGIQLVGGLASLGSMGGTGSMGSGGGGGGSGGSTSGFGGGWASQSSMGFNGGKGW